jgi:hypothetical protein
MVADAPRPYHGESPERDSPPKDQPLTLEIQNDQTGNQIASRDEICRRRLLWVARRAWP